MKKTLIAAITTLSCAAVVGSASADVMNLHFEEWELGGAFTYSHQLNGYEFGTAATINPGSWTEISVNSGPGSGGWDYELVIDYSEFCLDCLNPGGQAFLTVSGLEDMLEVAAAASSMGSVSFTDSTIQWSATANSLIFNSGVVTLNWNSAYIPAPGALALLGLAGVLHAGRRRDRRCGHCNWPG